MMDQSCKVISLYNILIDAGGPRPPISVPGSLSFSLSSFFVSLSNKQRLEVWLDHVVAQHATCTGMSIISA